MKDFSDLLRNLDENGLDGLEQQLLKVAQEKFSKDKLPDYFTWVKAVWVTARGTPLDFSNRKYLIQVYQDQYSNIVYEKSSQAGLSERLISEAVWLAEQEGMNTLYCFPAQAQLQDFVQARLNPILEMSEYLKGKIAADDTRTQKLGLKKIGRGHIYFRGSQNTKQIISVDADMVLLDERDRFVEDNVPYIDKRMNASKLKWRREASTPTIPGWGINSSFNESDQRVWEIPCKKCGVWQELDFFKNVDLNKRVFRCSSCQTMMDRTADGRWRITNPGSTIHGYKINGLYNPQVTVPELVAKYRKAQQDGFSSLQQFYNQDLGLPYEEAGQRVKLDDLEGCKQSFMIPVPSSPECFAGVDIGVDKHHAVVLSALPDNKYRLVWAGTLSHFFGPIDSIEALINTYHIKILVVDKRPETSRVKELVEKYPGKVFAADYPTMNFSVQEYFQWDDVKGELRLDRTISLDYLVADIQNRKIELPRNIEVVENFYDQLRTSIRITERNVRTGKEVPRWIAKGSKKDGSGGADHYFHALNFARMAQSRGVTGEALLDYYRKPGTGLTPSLIDWIRINGQRLLQ